MQSTRGVFGTEPVSPAMLRATMERLEEDLPFAGVKIGMLSTAAAAAEVGAFLANVARRDGRRRGPVVLDPVLRSSSGAVLFEEAGLPVLFEQLLPWVDWITPNWAELAVLSEQTIRDLESAERAARALQARQPHLTVVVTGGDQDGEPVDLLVPADGAVEVLGGERVETTSTHGTGCAVEGALRAAPGVGSGKGPMGLLWPLLGRV